MTRLAYMTALGGIVVAYFLVTNVALSRPHGNLNLAESSAAPVDLATSTDLSYNWAGYVADQGQYTAVSASWVVPEAQYPDGTNADIAADAAWVGIGGVNSHDLIQAGTQALIDSAGNTEYQAWYELLPDVSQPVNLDIEPGDSVSVAVTYVGNDQWHISFINNTTNKSAAVDVHYASSFSSAEWVEEMPSLAAGYGRASMPLDNFTRIDFTRASAVKDGHAVGLGESGAHPLGMQNGFGEALASPSTLSGTGDFSVVRGSATPAAPRRVHIIIIGVPQ